MALRSPIKIRITLSMINFPETQIPEDLLCYQLNLFKPNFSNRISYC